MNVSVYLLSALFMWVLIHDYVFYVFNGAWHYFYILILIDLWRCFITQSDLNLSLFANDLNMLSSIRYTTTAIYWCMQIHWPPRHGWTLRFQRWLLRMTITLGGVQNWRDRLKFSQSHFEILNDINLSDEFDFFHFAVDVFEKFFFHELFFPGLILNGINIIIYSRYPFLLKLNLLFIDHRIWHFFIKNTHTVI